MLRVFSGSCLSLDDMDFIRPRIVQEPHQLGPGVEFFDDAGVPIRPQPSAHTLTKVFSGSALDLNDMNPDDDEVNLPLSPKGLQQQAPSTILSSAAAMTNKERLRMQNSKTTVLVIGAGGYVGAHVVAALLDAGYTVRCAVRNMLDQHLVRELQSLVPAANHRLHIGEADITKRDSLRDHIKSCSYIIHCGVSSAELTPSTVVSVHEVAVRTLFDAIRAHGRSTVRRVILTGSAMSVAHPSDPLPPSGAFDESHWNSTSKASEDPLRFARVVFEREAWRLSEAIGVELSVVLPSFILGPSRTNETSEAMRTLHDLSSGSSFFPFAPEMYWNFVDVRDVADAHVKVLEAPTAAGKRYIVNNTCVSLAQLGRIVRSEFPHLHPPVYDAPLLLTLVMSPIFNSSISIRLLWRYLGKKQLLDSRRARSELEIEPRAFEHTVRDAVNELIQGGYLPVAGEAKRASALRRRAAIVGSLMLVAGVSAYLFKFKRNVR